MQARDSLATVEGRHICLMPLEDLAGTFRASSQALMEAADSKRKSIHRHFLNHLQCLSESHHQATRALSLLQESVHSYLECYRHEASGEPANTIIRMYALDTSKGLSQLARATSPPLVANQLMRAVKNRLNWQKRFCIPLGKVVSSPEFEPKTTGRTLKSSALCAHSKGGEAC
jgi:hypothetical protein